MFIMKKAIDITTHARELIQEHFQKKETFLVEFSADWCGPCKMLGPKLKELCAEKNVALLLVNGDPVGKGPQVEKEVSLLMEQYHVSAFPTTLIFKQGSQTPIPVVGARLEVIKSHL
jgi:thioredoxin 1